MFRMAMKSTCFQRCRTLLDDAFQSDDRVLHFTGNDWLRYSTIGALSHTVEDLVKIPAVISLDVNITAKFQSKVFAAVLDNVDVGPAR